jgi:hemoglobin
MVKQDILTDEDIERMVRKQYSLLLADEATAPKFLHLMIEEHFPRIFGFWKMVIFAQPLAYVGNAFQPHIKLDLEKQHFEKWIEFLTEAVNENFEGPNAQKVLQHAKLMAVIFQSKLGIQ